MSPNEVVLEGTFKPDGTLELDQKPNLSPGRVTIVGAGPGAADLITVRGADALREADVVVWAASLVHPDVLRYAEADGRVTPDANPNGSVRGIAGITNARGNVLGLMPHPERAAEAEMGGSDGRAILGSLAAWLREQPVAAERRL